MTIKRKPKTKSGTKRSRAHITYFDTGSWPIYFGFTTDAESFAKEMKRLGIEDPPPFVSSGWGATTHVITDDQAQVAATTVVVCLKRRSGVTRAQEVALLAHEACHVWNAVNKAMNGPCPGGEHQAYGVQWLTQRMVEEVFKVKP